MSIKVMSWVWDHSTSEGAARLVLLAIADCANADGAHAYPSMAELCRKTHLSERGVQKAIRTLTDIGELRVSGNGGRGRTNSYRILTETRADSGDSAAEKPRTGYGVCDPETPNTVPLLAKQKGEHSAGINYPKTRKSGTKPRTQFARNQILKDLKDSLKTSEKIFQDQPKDIFEDPLSSAALDHSLIKINVHPKINSTVSTRPDVDRLCDHLARRIVDNGCTPPAITKAWRQAARLLIDRDGRSEEDIHTAIDWCQDHLFWRANILSMPTLRAKYDRLRLQAQAEHPSTAPVAGRSAPPSRNTLILQAAMKRAQAAEGVLTDDTN